VDAAEKNDVRLRGLGLVAEPEGVADEIGHALDVLGLVVVREDDGVALFFEREDLLLDRGQGRGRGTRRKDEGLVVDHEGGVLRPET
jgi:hypothetical protein